MSAITLPASQQRPTRDEQPLLPLRLVIVGHVDHGKSSLIGRLLVETETVPPDRVAKVKAICDAQAKPLEYAFLLDALEEEQLQGITIDTTQLTMHTPRRTLQIIDAPGHKEFIKNMMTGAAQAEAALLIVDAAEGIREQTRRHAFLLHLLGIRTVLVLVNKMDKVAYQQSVFDQIKQDICELLSSWNVQPLHVLPISALAGDNVTSVSEQTPWYSGRPLLPILEALVPANAQQNHGELPLRFMVQDVYKFDERRILTGRISHGTVKAGDRVQILPSGEFTTVASLESWPETEAPLASVSAPMTVGLTLADSLFVERGNWVVPAAESASSEAKTPKATTQLRVNIFWMGHAPLTFGKRYQIKLGPQELHGELLHLESVMDSDSMEYRFDASEVGRYQVGEAVFQTEKPVMADAYSDGFVLTARCVVLEDRQVVGGGIVLEQADNGLALETVSSPKLLSLILSDASEAALNTLREDVHNWLASAVDAPDALLLTAAYCDRKPLLVNRILKAGLNVITIDTVTPHSSDIMPGPLTHTVPAMASLQQLQAIVRNYFDKA